MSKLKFSGLTSILSKHTVELARFFISNLFNSKLEKDNKISSPCPYCNKSTNKHKLLINLDWGNFKCFRCGESGSLIKLARDIGCGEEFLSLLSSITNVNSFNLQTLFRSNSAKLSISDKIELEFKQKNNEEIKEFIHSKSLLPITKMPQAKKYALKRVFNNLAEIESYLADEKYIYIPIINEHQVVAYLARLYQQIECPRYIMHPIINNYVTLGFFDEIINNMSNNCLYITEGYFDAYAINFALSNFVATCTFGKTKIGSIRKISKYLTTSAKIMIVLDSVKADLNIVNDIIKFGNTLSKSFENIYVIQLPYGDPAEYVEKNGSIALKEVLKTNSIPFTKYKLLSKKVGVLKL